MAYIYAQYAQLHSTCYSFFNGSIIPTGFKFTELHALTLATRSYALLHAHIVCLYLHTTCQWPNAIPIGGIENDIQDLGS